MPNVMLRQNMYKTFRFFTQNKNELFIDMLGASYLRHHTRETLKFNRQCTHGRI